MSRKALITGGAIAAVIAGGILAAGTAGATTSAGTSNAPAASHTLKLKAKRLATASPSTSAFVQTSTLFKAGKKVGFETQSCNEGGTGVACAVTFNLTRGVLLGHFTLPITTGSRSSTTGKITGGLAAYSGAHGTIDASFRGKHAKYVLTYHG